MTSSNIPDSFSPQELEAMLKDAIKESDLNFKQQTESDWEERVHSAAHEGLELMVQNINDPVVHKAALLRICNNMVEWHTKVGEQANQETETEAGTAWLRDAGKWQAIMTIALSISLGPNDFFTAE